MASDESFLEYILEKFSPIGGVQYKKMFGEYAIYSNGKVIGLVCDDQFFFKITKNGLENFPTLEQGQPFPSAKPWFILDEGFLEDEESLKKLLEVSLPEIGFIGKKKR